MRKLRRLRWWGLFALIPLTAALMVLDDDAPMSETWRLILLGGIVVVICVLAVAWTERNAGLVEREGVDAMINYRPLPGTIEAMGAEPSAQESLKAGQRRLVVDFDPMACPPVANNRPNDALSESSS
jgi:hypothetical protein